MQFANVSEKVRMPNQFILHLDFRFLFNFLWTKIFFSLENEKKMFVKILSINICIKFILILILYVFLFESIKS